MKTMRWFQTGVSPRGTPALRRALRRHPVVMLVLALAALGQAGCQTCSPCGSRIRNFSERVFRPVRNVLHGVGPCCGGSIGVESAPVIPYGTPSTVVPGTVVTPSGPGSVIQGPTESIPSNLEPIPSGERMPSAAPGSSSGGTGGAAPNQGARGSTTKSNYEAYRPVLRKGQGRPAALARTPDAGPGPTPRSAQGPSSPPAELNVLDNLPPLDLTPPPSDAASRETKPSASPGPAPAAETLADLAARRVDGGVTVAPGIRRFVSVDTKLSGGSLPTPEGLDWLAERGYKTILDLREDAELSPTFIADVARRGMRYHALPINAKAVDADHVERFNEEISLDQSRPLYFCDTDGNRAGVMWFLRRVTVDKVDELVARRDAEELGLNGNKFWLAASAYLATLKTPPSTNPKPAPADSPSPAATPAPPTPAPLKPGDDVKPAATGPQAAAVNDAANAPEAPSAGPPPERTSSTSSTDTVPSPVEPRDPSAWKPYAALVVTSLGVPLAYMSRSIPSGVLTLARASLPGPRRSTKSLPGGSGG